MVEAPVIPTPTTGDGGVPQPIVVHVQWEASHFTPHEPVTIQLYRYGVFVRNLTVTIAEDGATQSVDVTLPTDLDAGDGYTFNIVQGSVSVQTSPFTIPSYRKLFVDYVIYLLYIYISLLLFWLRNIQTDIYLVFPSFPFPFLSFSFS